MSTKAALDMYFDRLLTAWRDGHQSLPFTYLDEHIDPMMYVGRFAADGENFAYWQPLAKDLDFDFASIEAAASIRLHPSVCEYFNSYWFFDIEASYGGRPLMLYSVLPGREPQNYERTLREYRAWWQDREIDFAPIGLTANNDVIVVHKNHGQVCLMSNTEVPDAEPFAESLPALIADLEPFVWARLSPVVLR